MKQFSQKRWAVLLLAVVLMALLTSVAPALAQSAQPQFVTPIVVANTSFLNIRTGPGVQYTTLVTVVGGSELPVLAVGSDGVWYLVSTPVGIGWVNVEFTLPRGNFSVVPTINVNSVGAVLVAPVAQPSIALQPDGQGGGGPETTAAAQSTVERFRARINVETVNLRREPRDNSAPLTIMTLDPTGVEDYSIVGRSRDPRGFEWLQIDVPGVGAGWVEGPKLVFRLSARYRDVLQIVADAVGMVADPTTNEAVNLPVLTRNQEVFLLDITTNGLFVKVETGEGVVGWVPFNSVQTRTGTRSDIIVAEQGRQTSSTGIPAVDGQGGGGPALTIPRLELPHVVVNTSFLNIRSGPGGQYSVSTTVSGGDELEVIGISTDGFWFLVRAGSVIGWVDVDFVLFRGAIGNVPIINDAAALNAATVQTPVAVFSTALTLYAAPGVNFGAVAFVNGPGELPVVARTSDGRWVQVSSSSGFGWVLADQVVVRGDPALIPVVG